jgi:hypothetical protein
MLAWGLVECDEATGSFHPTSPETALARLEKVWASMTDGRRPAAAGPLPYAAPRDGGKGRGGGGGAAAGAGDSGAGGGAPRAPLSLSPGRGRVAAAAVGSGAPRSLARRPASSPVVRIGAGGGPGAASSARRRPAAAASHGLGR